MIRGSFVLAINEEGERNEVWKARFIVRGHLDKRKKPLLHNLVVAIHFTASIIVRHASTLELKVFNRRESGIYAKH